ncbi:PLC-like phosphodiesterase [Neolentinus lepideus HHB14362 ss-1]|uniref:PLC-like phosphodiesterase n=1 Tax=Neolentinus lepideus HHB14362 ss-1 TaxID=1314782 RepID=A0A165RG91_9AGAM|nr:PLC-like phosphodiesterase [Neolentinus lepideus HHB14362 ss-1]
MIPPSAVSLFAFVAAQARALFAFPAQEIILGGADAPASPGPVGAGGHARFFDIQAHRGGRGNTVENTLPGFAWGLINGATTLELDNGITKDGEVVVWHDENITPQKCIDTGPAFPDDPDYPYVGKFVANLTLSQLKTLDCGSKRQLGYPHQLTVPHTRISTLSEFFSFVECADPQHQMLFNIESKVNANWGNRTRDPLTFVEKQHKVFKESGRIDAITYQSFDWRTLVAMKDLDPAVRTSALIDDETAEETETSPSPWLAGLKMSSFPGPTLGEQIAQATHSIRADILSPAATALRSRGVDPDGDAYEGFVTREMVEEARRLGVRVKPWTVNRLNVAERMIDWKVDGIITDYPDIVRRWASQQNLPVAPRYPKQRVLSCLDRHMASS